MRLLFLYLILILIVFLKINANATYFLTPDSHFYLEAAQNILNGKGYTIKFEHKNTFCAIWPVGYSALITLLSFVSKVSIITSSKLVNLIAIGLIFCLLYRKYREKSWVVVMGFCASSFIQIYANTWSETVFMMCLVGFCLTSVPNITKTNQTHELSLFLWAAAAFLVRYIGFFLIIPLIFNKKYKAAAGLLGLMVLYCTLNYSQTQTLTGGHGFCPNQPFFERFTFGFYGIIEEILFFGIRDWDLKLMPNSVPIKVAIYSLSVIQAFILGVIIYIILKAKTGGLSTIDYRLWTKNYYVVCGLAYLISIFGIYLIDSSIESLYFRRLAPFSLLMVLAFLDWLIKPSQEILLLKIQNWLIAFFIISILHSIPKEIISCKDIYKSLSLVFIIQF